ncbi:hypothetical protein LX87_05031 [Larkinella arboricola]|uniref:Uncharacterized protein n=1 Tax=Larkinella arboricola TaxID=643671 RepID=A0A327WN16_LARAB|nr:hypothetical protein [Larkinella arboricola]RAJ92700.1 hypothetical protein LX87_05031 [Larkinella arboricola]
MDITIQKEILKSLINKAISTYLDHNYPAQEIPIAEDYFWHIEKDSLYQMNDGINPKDLNLGSLHDAVMELKQLANADNDYIPNHIDIRRISFVLRYLSTV